MKVTGWHVLHNDIVGIIILKAFDVLKYVCIVLFSKVMNNLKFLELLIVVIKTSLD